MFKKVLSILLSLMLVCSMASVTVLAEDASILANLGADALLYAPLVNDGNTSWLIDSVKLPLEFNGAKIKWTSSNGTVISDKGSLARPANADATVTLTATATKGDATETKNFTFNVPAVTTQVGSLPVLSGTLINDDFADYKKSAYAVYNTTNYETDGHLLLCYKSNASFYPYYDLGAADFEGDFYSEFVITKGKTHTGWIGFYGANGETIFALDYKNHNDKLQLLSYKGKTGEDENGNATYGWVYPTTTDASEFETVKIGIYFNSADQTVSIWINNREFIMNEITRWRADGKTDAITALDRIVVRSGSDINNIQLQDFKFYVVGENPLLDSEKVAYDAEALTLDKLYFGEFVTGNVIKNSIRLPIVGENGSEITWSSNNTAVCSDTGKISRPDGPVSVPVTLTATIKSGSETIQKTFDFTIAGKELDFDAMPTLLNNDESNYKTNLTFDTATDNVQDTKGVQTTLTFDGALKFIGASKYNGETHMGVRIRSNDKQEFLGVAAYEATISRSAKNTVDARIELSGGSIGFRTEWRSDGSFYTWYRKADGTVVKEEKSPVVVTGSTAKLVIFADSATDRVVAWVDGQKIADAYSFASFVTSGKKFRNFYLTCANTATTITIDDFKSYICAPATENRYETDIAHLAEWTLPAVIENNIGSAAQYGSYVKWTSDNEAIIDSKGNVTRPNDDLIHTVNLTANIMGINVGESAQKSFVANVAGTGYSALPSLLGNDIANVKADYNFDELPAYVLNVKGNANDLTCANGTLSFVGAANYNGSTPMGIRVRAADNAEFRGVAAFEADIARTGTGAVDFRIETSGGYTALQLEWQSSGLLQAKYKASADATAAWINTGITKSSAFNVKAFVDPRTDRLAVWFDDVLAIDAYTASPMASVETRKFRNMYLTCADTKTTIKVDNIKMYYALPATAHRLECDMVYFANYTMPESVTKDIELPSTLTYGSYLTWTSDNAALTADGVVTRGDEDVVVNLTATPSAAGVSGEAKTFAITVKAKAEPQYYIQSGTAENGGYKADFYCIKDDYTYPAANYILALYDGNEFITFKSGTFADGAFDETAPAASLEFALSEIPSTVINAKVKAFVWKDGTLTPLGANQVISAS